MKYGKEKLMKLIYPTHQPLQHVEQYLSMAGQIYP